MIKTFLADLEGVSHKVDEPLCEYTTFNIGGPADVIVFPQDEEELHRALKSTVEHNLPCFILGGGSNLLVGDHGIRGVVIHLGGQMEKIEVSEDGKEILVGTAVSFPKLTKVALDCGWSSALGWHGTPGLVGGALKMNAGGRLGELGDVVKSVHGVNTDGPCEFTKEQAGFRYRSSSFPTDTVLTFAKLRCESGNKALAAEFAVKARELVARRKQTQPKHRSAGSMFKNPPGDFAGRLIEAAGLKGTRIGDAEISLVHANFIVNLGKATANDVRELSILMKDTVFKQSGVQLEYEVKFVGDHG